MNKPTLVIMAAGMGSRFGGLKQMTPIDEQGHFIMDYSIFDAVRAGFGHVVCIIKEEMRDSFDAIIGARIRSHIPLTYVYQHLSDLPDGFSVPAGRTKPWGTGHAVLCAEPCLDGPFAVINADDFYGHEAFLSMQQFLTSSQDDSDYCMVGYALKNTLTENGTVSRGVCAVSECGLLSEVVERFRICKLPDGSAAYTEDGTAYTSLPEDAVVSMNFWGFQKSFLPHIRQCFIRFLQQEVPSNPQKAEFCLPTIVDRLLQDKLCRVHVLPCTARWHGITYREDLDDICSAVSRLKEQGLYPSRLWTQTFCGTEAVL